jgi:hypothetical protein
MGKAEHITEAGQDWPLVLQGAGIDAGPYAVARRWQKEDRARAHVIFLLSAPGQPGLIYKQTFLPQDKAAFVATIAAQDQAARALQDHEHARVPAVIASDPDRRAILMQAVPGETVFAHCEQTADHAPILERAGRWMAAFHRSGPHEVRAFQPRFMVDHMAKLATQVQSGQKVVSAKGRFLAFVSTLITRAPAHVNAQTFSAVKHGDMTCRNIMLGDGMAWGIDMAPVTAAPVGYDIARFLTNYAEMLADLDSLMPGMAVPQPAWDAFFRGYDLTGADDGSVRFLVMVRILSDWVTLPPMPDQMSVPEVIRFRRLRRIADNLFA